ncbi:MAG: hypothetical protein IJF12_02400 [Alphaproteobacteria bacterium]|nr:hypothetical protein [Alphaproteobacteria bacterium]
MTYQGWMPIYRRVQEHWLWQDKPFAKGQAWIDLLLLASHNENEFLFGNQVTKNEIGSFITSELKLADRWGWSKTKVRAFLSLLESEKMIVKKSDNKKTTINIVNYSIYADYETAKKLQKDNNKTSKKLQKNTINNDNNDNNDNKYIYIKDIYNEICVSFPRLTVLSDKRKKAIKARLNTYSVEQLKEVFIKAEASDFLKGKNNRNWSANFDWLIADGNFAKVLDGNYDNRKGTVKQEKSELEGVF